MTNTFGGVRIIESVYLTEAGEPYEVRRPWMERLFSRPWRPLQRTRTITPQVPMRGGLRMADGTIVMHPDTVRQLKAAIAKNVPVNADRPSLETTRR